MTPARKALDAEFEALSRFLLEECRRGLAHFEAWKLDSGLGSTDKLALRAYYDCAALILARLTDDHKDAKTVYTFVAFVRNHPHLFRLERRMLFEELKCYRLDEYGGTIRNLRALRDRLYAHNDREYFAEPERLLREYPVSPQDIGELLRLIETLIVRFVSLSASKE